VPSALPRWPCPGEIEKFFCWRHYSGELENVIGIGDIHAFLHRPPVPAGAASGLAFTFFIPKSNSPLPISVVTVPSFSLRNELVSASTSRAYLLARIAARLRQRVFRIFSIDDVFLPLPASRSGFLLHV